MANDITLILFGALCAWALNLAYAAFLYFRKVPEKRVFYRRKDYPWASDLVFVEDVREGFVKYIYYSKKSGFYSNNTLPIHAFFYIYKRNEDQNIVTEG